MADFERIKRNVQRIADGGGTDSEVKGYLRSEGVSEDEFRAGRESMGPVAAVGAGFNRVLADVVDAPSTISRAITNPVIGAITGRAPKEIPPSAVAGYLREISPEPINRGERIGQSVGKGLAYTLPATGMGLAAAGLHGSTKVMPATASLGERLLNEVLGKVAASPGMAAGSDVISGAGAGLGGGIAKEAYPHNPWAEMAGEAVGGMAPLAAGVTPTGLAVRNVPGAVGYLRKRFSADVGRQQAESDAAREIQFGLAGKEQALEEARRLQKDVPGLNLTLAEEAQSESLRATQEYIERKARGGELEGYVARRKRNNEAISAYKETAAPTTDRPVDYIFDPVKRKVEDLRSRVTEQEQDAMTARKALIEDLPETDKAKLGEVVRQQIKDERDATKQRLAREARNLGIDGIDATEPYMNWSAGVKKEFTPEGVFEDVANRPKVLGEIESKAVERTQQEESLLAALGLREKGEAGVEPEPLTFRDIKSLRERVSDDLIDELGAANPSRKKIRDLVRLKKSTDDLIEDIGVHIADPELAQRYTQFRRDWYEQYISRFEKSALFKTRQRDGRGFYRTADENVGEAFIKEGNITGARQLKAAIGQDKAEMVAESVLLDDLRGRVGKDGFIAPQKMTTWLRDNNSILNEFPGLKERVSNTASLNEVYADRLQDLAARKNKIDDTNLVKVIQRLDRLTLTPEKAAERMLVNEPLFNSTWKRMDESGKRAFRRHVWDQVADEPPENIEAFIRNNRNVLGRVFDPEHLKALETIQKARYRTGFTNEPEGMHYEPGLLRNIERRLGQKIPVAMSRFYAFKTGRMDPAYLMTDIISRSLQGRSRAHAEDVFKQALYDKNIAREMALTAKGVPFTVQRMARLNGWLVNLAIEDEEQFRQ